MATSAYLSPGPPPLSDQEEGGVMNLVNPAVTSQSYSVPREQVVSGKYFGTKINKIHMFFNKCKKNAKLLILFSINKKILFLKKTLF